MKNSFVIFLVFFLVAITSGYSQGKRENRMDGKREKQWDRVEDLKKIKMIEELNLPEDISVKFISRYSSFSKQTKEINKQRMNLVDELEFLLKNNNQAEITKRLDQLEEIEKKVSENKRSFIADVKQILSPEKVAKFIVFERNFQRELRDLLKDVQNKKRKD